MRYPEARSRYRVIVPFACAHWFGDGLASVWVASVPSLTHALRLVVVVFY
jgi:hypothetical protein